MRWLLVAVLLHSATVHADTVENERQALSDRGIVFQVGKRFMVLLPPAQQEEKYATPVTLNSATLYVGGATKLTRIRTAGWTYEGKTDFESTTLIDPWQLVDGTLLRTASTYQLVCQNKNVMEDRRDLRLERADTKTATALLAKATLHDETVVPTAVFLGRTGTTYVYVDTTDYKSYRLFMGKRGSMKSLAIKEIVDDAEALILVTVKGTLTVKKTEGSNPPSAATFGSAKKPGTLVVQSTLLNRRLIYRDLGVYKSTPAGHPCYEL